MRYTIEIASLDMMYIPSFVARHSMYLRNLEGCNVGITDVRDL
jgi:hypothetical protein